MEKIPSTKDVVYIGKFICTNYNTRKNRCQRNSWEYVGKTATVSTSLSDVYSSYETGDWSSDFIQNVNSNNHGYNYVDFAYNTSLDSNYFYIYQYLGEDNTKAPYCQWQQTGSVAYRAVEYQTLQRYTIWYEDLYQISNILSFTPSTTCAVSLDSLSIQVQKNNWAQFYTSQCDNFDQVLFTVYISNTPDYFHPQYIIDIFKSERYDDTWGYTIFDNNCKEQKTVYINSKNVNIDSQGMLRSILLNNIPLNYLSNLDLSNTIYSWIKYKATEDSVNNLTVTLTLTATYEVIP